MSACPCNKRWRSSASFTWIVQRLLQRSAKALVNFSGMCWTMTTPGAGDHHHRHRMSAHELFKKGQAVHPRHLDVERQHVRLELADLVASDIRVRSNPDDL